MNLDKVFDFIKEKRGYEYPFLYKLLNDIPLSEDDLNVGGDLLIYNKNITTLPDNLRVEENLLLHKVNVSTIPNNLHVGRNLSIADSPLSDKYSESEIRKMIVDNGGYIGMNISM